MKHAFFKSVVASMAFAALVWTSFGESASFNVETRVGDGWHMNTTAVLSDNGQIKGTTTLKNYNNVFGFTGGVFAVALDARGEAIFSTEIHNFGINASFFKKSVTRTATWTDSIPEQYLAKVDRVAVVQVHNPNYRVWTWIYSNRDTLIAHAKAIANLYKKYQNNELTSTDINDIIKAHLSQL